MIILYCMLFACHQIRHRGKKYWQSAWWLIMATLIFLGGLCRYWVITDTHFIAPRVCVLPKHIWIWKCECLKIFQALTCCSHHATTSPSHPELSSLHHAGCWDSFRTRTLSRGDRVQSQVLFVQRSEASPSSCLPPCGQSGSDYRIPAIMTQWEFGLCGVSLVKKSSVGCWAGGVSGSFCYVEWVWPKKILWAIELVV